MLNGHLRDCNKRVPAMNKHEVAVRGLSTNQLRQVVGELRFSSRLEHRARRMAALDELERRGN